MRAARADGQIAAGALCLGGLVESFAVDRVALDRFLVVISFKNARS